MTQYSYSSFTGNGSRAVFTFSFDYMKRAHVAVKVDGATKVDGTDYDWTADKQITFKAGKIPASGEKILIVRDTPENDQIVQWQNGSYIVAEDLNESDLQWLYNIQELYDNDEALSDRIDDLNGGTSGPAVKKITGTVPIQVDSTKAQEPDISIDQIKASDDPNLLISDTDVMSAQAIDGAFSQIVGDGSSYPPAGYTGKLGKLRVDNSGSQPDFFYWNGTSWVQIPTKGDKGDAATITVKSTTTTAPGTDANVTNAGTTSAAELEFEIPRGDVGPPPGLQSPAANAANVPLKAGNVLGDATAAVTADSSGDLRFSFGIPVGKTGEQGERADPVVISQDTQPTFGDDVVWFNTVNAKAYFGYTDPTGDQYWVCISIPGPKGDKGDTGAGPPTTIADTAPADPGDGYVWHNSHNGRGYVYWSSQGVWVEM